jgi:predicted transglutaminase-like cysteine proteinase
MVRGKSGRALVTAVVLVGGLASAGKALALNVDFTNPAFAAIGHKQASTPIGHAEFCHFHRGECGPNAQIVDAVALTEVKWKQLIAVNNQLNTAITPVTDEQLYHVPEFWTYPEGYGDCEDYALAKRRALMQDGWPASTLLMTVVRQKNGEGHAVLMVRTDRGDLILDNQDALIKVWTDTPYQYLKRQSQTDSSKWVDIFDPPTRLAAAQS